LKNERPIITPNMVKLTVEFMGKTIDSHDSITVNVTKPRKNVIPKLIVLSFRLNWITTPIKKMIEKQTKINTKERTMLCSNSLN
jgi:hypothetical protein